MSSRQKLQNHEIHGVVQQGTGRGVIEREEFRNTNVIHQPHFKDREVEGSERLSDFSNRIAQEGSWQRRNSNQALPPLSRYSPLLFTLKRCGVLRGYGENGQGGRSDMVWSTLHQKLNHCAVNKSCLSKTTPLYT